jgi:hypothetical protein
MTGHHGDRREVMSTTDDGGPAFPHVCPENVASFGHPCMTLRQYAAIKLCVPDSGTEWLDDMIRQAQRDRFAAQALAGFLSGNPDSDCGPDGYAHDTYLFADEMLAARTKGAAS